MFLTWASPDLRCKSVLASQEKANGTESTYYLTRLPVCVCVCVYLEVTITAFASVVTVELRILFMLMDNCHGFHHRCWCHSPSQKSTRFLSSIWMSQPTRLLVFPSISVTCTRSLFSSAVTTHWSYLQPRLLDTSTQSLDISSFNMRRVCICVRRWKRHHKCLIDEAGVVVSQCLDRAAPITVGHSFISSPVKLLWTISLQKSVLAWLA